MIVGAVVGLIMLSLAIFGGYKLIERDQEMHNPPTMSEHQ